MPSNLKRLLNDVDGMDYYAAEQYARRPPAPSLSPVREGSPSSVSTATSPAGTCSYYSAFGSPREATAPVGSPASLRSGLGGILGLAGSGRVRDDLPGPAVSGLSILEREMDAFGQDLVAYGTSSSSSTSMSMRSSASPHSFSVYTMASPTAPAIGHAPVFAASMTSSSSEGHHYRRDDNLGSGGSGSSSGAAQKQIVCYGMLHRVDVKIVGEMALLDGRLAASAGHAPYQRFALTELPDHIMLSFKDSPAGYSSSSASPASAASSSFPSEFGYLRSHMKANLDQLLSRPDVEFEAVAPTGALRDVITGFKKSSDALVRVDVNVYGPRGKVAKTVGRMLSRKRQYLQTPDCSRPGIPYENPQRVVFSGLDRTAEGVQISRDLATPRDCSDDRVRSLMDGVYGALGRGDLAQHHYSSSNNSNSGNSGGNSGSHYNYRHDSARLSHPFGTSQLPHQEVALGFMLGRETGNMTMSGGAIWEERTDEGGDKCYTHAITKHRSRTRPEEPRGGILADEAGMGKTLSVLGLIRETLADGRDWEEEQKKCDESNSQYRGVTCSRSTLVLVPSDAYMDDWVSQIATHTQDTLGCVRHEWPCREVNTDADVVVATYGVLSAEFSLKRGPLHQTGWYRVVLDEAHFIRSPVTPFHRACCELVARSRWCITSTPVPSRLEDLGSLLAFLRVVPFDSLAVFHRFIEVPFEIRHQHQHQHQLPLPLQPEDEDPPAPDDHVIENNVEEQLLRLVGPILLRRTRSQIGEAVSPQESVRLVELSLIEREHYDRVHQSLARSLLMPQQHSRSLGRIDSITLFRANLRLRMAATQGTFHQHLAHEPLAGPTVGVRGEEREAAANSLGLACSNCQQMVLGAGSYIDQCGHVVCPGCFPAGAEPRPEPRGRARVSRERVRCPLCSGAVGGQPFSRSDLRTPLVPAPPGQPIRAEESSSGDVVMSSDEELPFHPDGCSSKMEQLISDIGSSDSKGVVLSCWTRTLDLAAMLLRLEGIAHRRIEAATDCSLAHHRRQQAVVDEFAADPSARVLLMTTGAASAAGRLDFGWAKRVFIVEPQYSVHVEDEVVARIIGLGRGGRAEDGVEVIRYVVKNSVEESWWRSRERG